MIYFGSYGGNTIPIENRIQNWGKARVEIVGLKCDLFFIVMKAIQHFFGN